VACREIPARHCRAQRYVVLFTNTYPTGWLLYSADYRTRDDARERRLSAIAVIGAAVVIAMQVTVTAGDPMLSVEPISTVLLARRPWLWARCPTRFTPRMFRSAVGSYFVDGPFVELNLSLLEARRCLDFANHFMRGQRTLPSRLRLPMLRRHRAVGQRRKNR
jgi:hypothetical protein